jgi:hypothetical protein
MIAGSEVVLLIRRSRLRHERHHFLCRAAKRRAVWRGGMRSRKIDAEMCTATFLWPQSGDGDHQRDNRRISFRPIGIGQRQQRLRGSTSAPRSRNAPAVCDGSGRTVDGSASGNTLDSSTIGCRGRAAHARRSFPFSRCCGDRAEPVTQRGPLTAKSKTSSTSSPRPDDGARLRDTLIDRFCLTQSVEYSR